MSKTKDVTYTIPDLGRRESVLAEDDSGNATCTYRVRDNGNESHSAVFTGTDIVTAWGASAAYFSALQAANPGIDAAALATQLTFVRAVLKAYGDAACGFS